MKPDIHPTYVETQVTCSCGNAFTTRSTAKSGSIHADGEGTRLVYTEQGSYLGDPEGVAGREEGSRGLLDALGADLDI